MIRGGHPGTAQDAPPVQRASLQLSCTGALPGLHLDLTWKLREHAPMSLSSSQSRKEELGAASNLSMRYLAAFSLPLVAGNTSAWPRLNAHTRPSGMPFIAAFTSSSVLLP